jgi:hypothetical protein
MIFGMQPYFDPTRKTILNKNERRPQKGNGRQPQKNENGRLGRRPSKNWNTTSKKMKDNLQKN